MLLVFSVLRMPQKPSHHWGLSNWSIGEFEGFCVGDF